MEIPCNPSSRSAKGGQPLTRTKNHLLHLQRDHPHPEHRLISDIDVVFAHEGQLAVIAEAENREAGGYCLYRIAVPHIHRQIVLRDQNAAARVDVKGARMDFWVSMCWIGFGSPVD